jgi:hypothetical protein
MSRQRETQDWRPTDPLTVRPGTHRTLKTSGSEPKFTAHYNAAKVIIW